MTVQSYSNTDVVGTAFTITATAGANGTITPTGTIEVGQGGSQTFTFAPNANYRINEVLIDGVTDAGAAAAGTYTFTDVQADHTIDVSFTQSAAVITSTAGAGGTIAPLGNQTVPINGSQTYTITPNNGYSILDVKVDDVSVGAVPSYTFTGVTANHKIDATFQANFSTITVTVPNGTEAWTTASTQNLGWTLNAAVPAGGQFGVWLINQTTGSWYDAGYYDTVAGQTDYAPAFTVPNVPDGTYKAAVYYRADPTQWVWSVSGASAGAATITQGGVAITVTVPNGIESWPTGSTQSLGWTLNAAVPAGGQFGVWLINQTTGSWYDAGYYDTVDGQTSYTPSFVVPAIPAGSYSVIVYYRTDPTQWVWQTSAFTSATATVTAGGPLINVDVPNGTETWAAGSTQSLGWSILAAVDVGQFGVWLVNETTGSWYDAGYYDAVPLQNAYTPSFIVPAVPAGTYKAVVYYRPDPTQWVWSSNALSAGAASITVP